MKRFKKLLSMMLAIVMVVGVVNLPAKAAESVTLGLSSAHIRTAAVQRVDDFLIYLTGIDSAQVTANVKISHIYVDDKLISNRTLYAMGDGAGWGAFTISPSDLVSEATLPAEVDRHFVTIPKGATIGDVYTVASDFTLYFDGATEPTVVDKLVSLGYKSTTIRTNDYLNYLTGFTAEELDAIGTNGMNHDFATGDLLVDGVSNPEPYLWNLGSGNLALIANYSHLKSGAASATDITEDHIVTLRKGTKIGSYRVDRDLTLKFNGSTVEWVNKSDAEPTLSVVSGSSSNSLLLLKAEEIGFPPADTVFEPCDSDAVFQYNGTNLSAPLIYSKWGLYADVATITGETGKTAAVGDVITIKGLWRYMGNRYVYDFGTTNYSWNGTEWIEGIYVDATPVTFTISQATDSAKLYITTSNIPHAGNSEETARDTFFEAVDDSSVFKFNDTDISVKPRFAFGGLYLAISEVTSGAQSAVTTGDTITIGGLWKHLYDGAYYDFGDAATYKWNGSNWIKTINVDTDAVVPSLTIAANRSDLLMLAIEGVTTPTGDTGFEAYDANSVYLYNGETSKYNMIYSRWGGIYADVNSMSKKTAPDTGDTITIGGVWKYTGNGKYYNFGTTVYEWDGSKWEVQPTPLTLTESQVVDRPGNNDWIFYMTPSFTIDDAIFGDATYKYLGVCNPIVKDSGTETTATNSEVYIFSSNPNVGITIKRTYLSGTPTAGTTVTFPAGMRITYDGVVYRTTEDFVWQYNGSSWVKYVKPDYYTPTLFTGSNTETTGVYLTCDDDMPYDTNWQLSYTAKDNESGVWVNGSRTEVFLKKIDATKWYVCLTDKDISATRGTTVAVKGTFINDTNEIEFTETTYIYDGTKWLTGSELDWDFAITDIGDCEYEAGLGWKLRFETDSMVYGEDFATELGTYKIQIDGVETTVGCTSATGYGLGILIEDLEQYPQGTIVTIPSGTIGDYTLTNTYEIIYDAGEWKLAHEAHSVTLSFSHEMGGDTNNLIFHHTEDVSAFVTKGQNFSAAYADSGIYVNGKKVEDASIFWWTEESSTYFVVQHVNIGAENVGDIVTVKGTFKNTSGSGDVYLNFSEESCRYATDTSGLTNWVPSCNYESVEPILVTGITNGLKQDDDESKLYRWLFVASTSIPLEHNATASFGSPLHQPFELTVTITSPEGEATTLYNIPTYTAENPDKTAIDHLGFFVTFEQGLPKDDTDGWSVTIEPSILQTSEKTYRIMSPYTYKYINNQWQVETTRPDASGVFADANGDGKVNAADYVAVLKEYTGVRKEDGTPYCCTTDALIAGQLKLKSSSDASVGDKLKLQDSDVIRIREELLDQDSSAESYTPVYLDDEEIQLAAYKGPRAIAMDLRYDDNGNQLKAETDYTKTSFLTDEMFLWYKEAGLNTLIAEGDAPFNSEGSYGLQAAPGYWTNLVNYMTMAAKQDLDVYVTSGLVNAYLRGGSTVTATNGTETTITPTTEDMQKDLTEMLTGEGSTSHTSGLLAFDNFKGVMLADELHEDYLDNYYAANLHLASIDPNIEVTSAALSADVVGYSENGKYLITSSYVDYIAKYAKYSMNRNLVYDYYPYQAVVEKTGGVNIFGTVIGGSYDYDAALANAETNSSWLTKLETSASVAQSGGWTTGIAIQSYAMKNYASKKIWRSPDSKDDIGFQVYTALAYGMKNFNYFTYWEHNTQSTSGEVHTDSMVYIDSNNNPQKTDIYYAVQAVNNEITQFDHVFLDYDWRSTYTIGSSSLFSGLTSTASAKIDTTATSANNGPAIIGCMYDDQKDLEGFWIVNANIPEDDKSNTVTVKFNDATRAMVYNPAQGIYGDVIELTNGTYTANLGSGEGQFVIPLQ